MSKMIRVRIKNNKVNELSKREKELNSKGIDTDLIGIPSDFRRLSKGITEETIEVSDKEIYLKTKKIQRLNKIINELESQLKLLMNKRSQLSCKKPSMEDLLTFTDKIIDVSKGKFNEPKK